MGDLELTPEDAAQRILSLLQPGEETRKKKEEPEKKQERRRKKEEEDALALALALVEQYPDNMSALYVAGQACWQAGRREDAIAYQKRLIACDPLNGHLHRNLAELLFRMGDQPGMAAAAAAAEAAGVEDSTLMNNGGLAHYNIGDADRALEMYRRAVEIDPNNVIAQRNISVVLMDRGQAEDAVEVYGKSLTAWTPDAEGEPPDSLTARYDVLADTYDDNALHDYFSRAMASFIKEFLALDGSHRVLDVACGTGGVAQNLAETGARFWGLDLSRGMLDIARRKGGYEDLREGDMIAGMAGHDDPFDVIVCCAALCHLNALDGFFAQASRLLRSGGYLFFSVDPALDTIDIGLTGRGEYAHSRAYLRRLAAGVELREREIRIMRHRMTPGFWCAYQR